jgi:acetyl esterase/lipase
MIKHSLPVLLGFTALTLTACETTPIQTSDASMAEKEIVMNEPAPLMSWPDLTNRRKEAPTETVRIGDGDTDIVDVWLPDGPGPHPVVLMVHGGCWQKSIADRTLMNYAAEAMRNEGLAVWNIEYRGVDEEGGGYPGTFYDVVKAADALQEYGEEFNLDLSRVAGFGHSAGGHLVTWLAGRKNLPATSVLAGGDPLQMLGVVNSGGLADLEASEPLTLKSCLAEIKGELIGEVSDARPDPLSDTSSDRLLPTGAVIYSVNGERDRIAPPALGDDFTAKAKQAGDKARVIVIPNEGHVELIAPGSDAFEKQVSLLKEILGED